MDQKKRNRILYVDDEKENLIGLRVSFSPYYEVETALDTQEAMVLLAKKEICLVLVDYKMPDIDGISFIEKVKCLYPDLVFIVVTAYAEIDVVIRALDLHCIFSFVQKPWQLNDLKFTIDKAIEMYQIRVENKRLKDDLIEKNICLNQALGKEQKINHYKTSFIRNLSHEVRTPLNGILGFASLAKGMDCDGEIKSYIDLCIESCGQLVKTFDNIMYASEIFSDTAEIVPCWFYADEMALSQIDALTGSYSEFPGAEVALRQDHKIRLFTDKNKLAIAFAQILHNALKFSNGEPVVVELEQYLYRLTIRVSDLGEGISEEVKPKIFEPFFQQDVSTTRRYEGNGLGLFIANSYVQMLGGNIYYNIRSGQGSVFAIELPLDFKEQ